MVTSTGSVEVLYRDTNADVGARFVGSTGTGSIDYTNSGNFEELGNVFTSTDYHPALSKYTFSLTTSTGSIDVDRASQ